MEVRFTREQETRLAEIATKAGTDVEQVVREAALCLLTDKSRDTEDLPELPVWHLGSTGAWHRREIYDDGR